MFISSIQTAKRPAGISLGSFWRRGRGMGGRGRRFRRRLWGRRRGRGVL